MELWLMTDDGAEYTSTAMDIKHETVNDHWWCHGIYCNGYETEWWYECEWPKCTIVLK